MGVDCPTSWHVARLTCRRGLGRMPRSRQHSRAAHREAPGLGGAQSSGQNSSRIPCGLFIKLIDRQLRSSRGKGARAPSLRVSRRVSDGLRTRPCLPAQPGARSITPQEYRSCPDRHIRAGPSAAKCTNECSFLTTAALAAAPVELDQQQAGPVPSALAAPPKWGHLHGVRQHRV